MCSAALPARGAIPAMNFRTMRHRGSMPDKRAFVRDARHGYLHYPKKPFVTKPARCDLSTVQALVHTYRLLFCLVPSRQFSANAFNGFDTRTRLAGSVLSNPFRSPRLADYSHD